METVLVIKKVQLPMVRYAMILIYVDGIDRWVTAVIGSPERDSKRHGALDSMRHTKLKLDLGIYLFRKRLRMDAEETYIGKIMNTSLCYFSVSFVRFLNHSCITYYNIRHCIRHVICITCNVQR